MDTESASDTETSGEQRTSSGAILGIGFVVLVALMLAIAGLVVAISNRHSSTGGASDAVPMVVRLTDFHIAVPSVLPAGTYNFDFVNDGKQAHEVLVFATDLLPSQFPKEADGTVNEEGAGLDKVSDGENIDPGADQQRTVELTKPGHYVFVCNLPDHFAQGMYTGVTIP